MAKKKTTKKTTQSKSPAKPAGGAAPKAKAAKKPAKAASVSAAKANASKKTAAKASTTPKKKPAVSPLKVHPTYDMIAARAFVVWERNGKQQGQNLANWKQAEAELLAEAGL